MKKKKLLAFIHIEKTAGTAVNTYLSRNLLGYHPCESYSFSNESDVVEDDDVEDQYLNSDELSKMCQYYPLLSGIGGHSLRSNVGYGSGTIDTLYFSFLREPLSRVLSQLHYHREVMNIDWTVEEFLADGGYNNLMCRRICGSADAEQAIGELKRNFYFVGLMEFFDESLQHFRELTNEQGFSFKNIKAEAKNVRSKRNSTAISFSEETIDQIKALNEEDYKLYEFVRQAGPTLDYRFNWGDALIDNNSTQWSISDYGRGLLNRLISVAYIRRLENLFRKRASHKIS